MNLSLIQLQTFRVYILEGYYTVSVALSSLKVSGLLSFPNFNQLVH